MKTSTLLASIATLALASVSSVSHAGWTVSTDDGDDSYPSISKTCDVTEESPSASSSDTESWELSTFKQKQILKSFGDGDPVCARADVYINASTLGDAAYATSCYEGTVDFYNGDTLLGTYALPKQCNYSTVDGDLDITGSQYAYFLLDGTDPSLGYSAVLNATVEASCFPDGDGNMTDDVAYMSASLHQSRIYYGSDGTSHCPDPVE